MPWPSSLRRKTRDFRLFSRALFTDFFFSFPIRCDRRVRHSHSHWILLLFTTDTYSHHSTDVDTEIALLVSRSARHRALGQVRVRNVFFLFFSFFLSYTLFVFTDRSSVHPSHSSMNDFPPPDTQPGSFITMPTFLFFFLYPFSV